MTIENWLKDLPGERVQLTHEDMERITRRCKTAGEARDELRKLIEQRERRDGDDEPPMAA